MQNLEILIRELCQSKTEKPWVEFKHNNFDPEMIGQDISALANSATLNEREVAYMVWGVHDKTHEILGTNHNLQTLKKGNEELESWLRHQMSANTDFQADYLPELKVCILTIHKAMTFPVVFEKTPYIRIGTYTKPLRDYPQQEAKLWERLRNAKFEDEIALADVSLQDINQLLNISVYFDRIGIPQPTDVGNSVHYLVEDKLLHKQDNGLLAITNLGAILFAKNLKDFPTVSRKAMRIIQYDGKSKLVMLKEEPSEEGYAICFEKQFKYLEAILPSSEPIIGTTRVKKNTYPSIALREALANALIHQDLTVSGTGPMVEVFANRIEITNPGRSLVDIERVIDSPPQSRNEKLSAVMRRMSFCEEAGTGWDKIALAVEAAQLPAPQIELYENGTKVVFFAEIPFRELSQEEKLRATYIHACIQHLQGDSLTNTSLRTRFGLEETSSASISRLIKVAIDQKLIKLKETQTSTRYMRYVPIWA